MTPKPPIPGLSAERERKNEGTKGRSRIAPYADVELELTRLTFHKMTPVIVIGGVGLVVTTALLAAHYHDAWLWKLTLVAALVSTIHIRCVIAYAEHGPQQLTLAGARSRLRIWAALTLAYGGCMAASTLYNFGHHDHTATSVCIMGVFGICAGMSSSVTAQPRVLQACGLMMMASLGWGLFFNSPPLLARAGASICLFYSAVHCRTVQTRFEIMVDQVRLRHQMRDLAERDMLTGLPNRRQFQARLTNLCAELTPFAILYIDLDRFKQVNDTFGHAMGDALLVQVAQRLTSLIRSSDLLARLGGDEFAILQYPVDSEAPAQVLASRINEGVASPFVIDEQQVEVGASIGICLAGESVRDPTRLLSLADKALYNVKQAGRGSFQLGEFQH